MTLSELNQRYAIGNHVQFKEIADGMIIAEIANQHALANIALQGAHIATFQPRDIMVVLDFSHSMCYDSQFFRLGMIPQAQI